MLRLLIPLALLIGSSFFLTEASSFEIEFQKESERIIDSMGWLEPEKTSFQEQIQILIDHTNSKNRISVGLLSQDTNDIIFTDELERLVSEPKVISVTITNQFACSPNNIDHACVIIDLERKDLGSNINEIRENTREITDRITSNGIIMYKTEFDSILLKPKIFSSGEKVIVSQALYTINKQSTESMFRALSNTMISENIRTSGGFYDHAKELSKNNFSSFSMSLIPTEDGALRTFQISLICSDKLPELIRCPGNVSHQITNGDISPLEFLAAENISRTGMFKDEFLPLNSIIQVLIFSDQDLQVKSVNGSVVEKLQHLGDVQDDGWFFSSMSGKKIDARYLFGSENSINKNNLVFSIGSNSGDAIEVKEDGGCLIATAVFGSELSPQVQLLREIRDNTILKTESGSMFMAGFNQFYYSFSPTVADYERENPIFKEAVKITLTPLLTSLTLLHYADIDSEYEMLGYGIGTILLNIGMYFVAPAIVIMKIKKRV